MQFVAQLLKFNKYILSVYYLPGTMLGTGGSVMNRTQPLL